MKFPRTKNETNETKKEVKKLLNKHGWFWWSPPANGLGKTGISDVHAVRPGVFMVVEAKHTETSRGLTSNQIGFLNSIKGANHFAFVVDETTLIHFQRFLELFEAAAQLQTKNKPVPVEIGGPLLDCIRAMTDYPEIQEPNL